MKASIKFRDEQKPLLRAKVPINILNFPFQSAITAGEHKELSLNLATLFDSGPSLKFSYRPNDSQNPFSLIFKTGIGHFGSPAKSPLTMSAEFKLVGSQNPGFFINFKPNFGDFSLKKSHSSEFVKNLGEKLNGEMNHNYFKVNSFFPSPLDSGVVNGLLKGTEISARTVFPVGDFAAVNFRWGVRIPTNDEGKDLGYCRNSGIGLPLLVMNKIGIEHLSRTKLIGAKSGDFADVCLEVKEQLGVIQAENGMLSKGLSDLRADIAAGKMDFYGANRRSNGDKKSLEMKGFGEGKAINGEGKEEA